MSKYSPIVFKQKGDFTNFEKFLQEDRRLKELTKSLERFGERGVEALASATPVRTGKTAASWKYQIQVSQNGVSLQWHNDNLASDGTPVVKLLVRGHGTRNGHYVRGNNFVTPAIKPIFDEIAEEVWSEVFK